LIHSLLSLQSVEQSGAGASPREKGLCNGINPWLAPLAMVVSQDIALKLFFRQVVVLGQEHLPRSGPVLLAPTHRSRWDALLLPHAAGRRVTGRDCRFMVTVDEMVGLQGWLLHRLGCFPVQQGSPSMASLRYPLDLLSGGQQLVVFPEGQIQPQNSPLHLHQGLARLALMAAARGETVTLLPVGIAYEHSPPRWGDRSALCFAPPLAIGEGGRSAAIACTAQLAQAMQSAESQAREALDIPA